jgi:hypothetical protein
VVNTVRYPHSSDIMKFATLASIALSVAACAALSRLLPRGRPASPARTAVASVLLSLVCVWGVTFPLCYALNLDEIPHGNQEKPSALDPSDVDAVVLLRRLARPGEMVYRAGAASYGYAQWGGLPQPQITWSTRAFGFPPARIAAREQLLHDVPEGPGPWRAQGFRWFVLEGSDEDTVLRERALAWVAEGEARLVATFGALQVIELLSERAAGAEAQRAENP